MRREKECASERKRLEYILYAAYLHACCAQP